jgi:methylated-DNA-protein-cysteine methyltransferase-like protein
MTQFSQKLIDIIKAVPEGRVITYGQAAEMAGNPRGARQTARLLHSSSEKYGLPWHRVVNREGRISLKGEGGLIQRGLLEAEGIEVSPSGRIDLKKYGYFIT